MEAFFLCLKGSESMFVDRVKLNVKAGNGGNGMVSFRREKYVPFGGPYGGDGGNGGNIIFEVDTHKSTLLDLRFQHHLKAKNGEPGKNKKMHGADGKDLIIQVPVGTVVRRLDNDQIIADLVTPGQTAIIAKGGKGGRGNFRFASANNPAPEMAEVGALGEEFEIEVELKLLADVGLVGFPSVGKSTLLSVVSAAKPEIGDYPFTTLVPNLGVVQSGDDRSFVMADLPGLIENAAQGKGLGHQFLKHIERCRLLVHIIDMSGSEGRDPLEDYEIIMNELKEYEYRLLDREMIIVANKMDLDGAKENLVRFKEAYPELTVYETVTLTQEGTQKLVYAIADKLDTIDYDLFEATPVSDSVVFKYEAPERGFEVEKIGENLWQLTGAQIEHEFRNLDENSEASILYFSRRLKTLGVDQYLREQGVQNGDTIILESVQFEFID